MFEPPDELASDLEWMLESGQVGRDLLAEVLVQEFALELYHPARLYLGNAAQARQAVTGAFAAALANIYRYRHGMGVKSWVFRFLVAEWRRLKHRPASEPRDEWSALEHQKPRLRELGVLAYGAGLNLQEVARVLGAGEGSIERHLKELQVKLLLDQETIAGTQVEEYGALDLRLRAASRLRSQVWNDPPLDLEALTAAALAEASRRGNRRGGVLRVQELGLVAAVIALAVVLIWGRDGLLAADRDELAFQSTQTAVRAALAATSQPEWNYNAGNDRQPEVNPPRRVVPDPDPEPSLSLASNSDEIHRRLAHAFNFRRNLWLDASIRLYPPQGPTGFPKEYHVQLWYVRNSDRFIILSGPESAPIQEIYYSLYGQPFQFLRSEAGAYEITDIADGLDRQGYYLAFHTLLSQMMEFNEGDRYIPREMARFLERSVLVVDRVNLAGRRVATLLLDTTTGFALRQRYYHPDDQSLSAEIDVLDLSFPRSLPEQVFSPDFPWNGSYPTSANLDFEPGAVSSPPLGLPVEIPTPPAGYRADDQQIYFEFTSVYAVPSSHDESLGFRARIYTADYFLGEIDFANPWKNICQRSPDGALLAFVDIVGISYRLYWFDLNELNLESIIVNGRITQLAFSPDGQRLAFFEASPTSGAVQIYDLTNGEVQSLIALPDARSLVWSPDGHFLTLIGRTNQPEANDSLMVIQVDPPAITYESSVDFNADPPEKWLPLRWEVDFPVEMDSLIDCAQPPGDG